MRDVHKKQCAICLLLAAAGFGLIQLGACRDQESPAATPQQHTRALTILTPYNKNIRLAFATGFSDWHRRNHGEDVSVNWIERGTPQCVQYVEGKYTRRPEQAPRGSWPDLFFGGGVADHSHISANGWSIPVNLDELVAQIPPEVNGIPTRDEQKCWVATGLTSFGMLVNQQVCQVRGIEPPETFASLAEPRFAGWISLAEPATSGSNRQCLMLIINELGWQQGWSTVIRILANARALNERSSSALDQVQTGIGIAAFAVNYDGLSRVEQAKKSLTYVTPIRSTSISLDVISILQSRRDADLAQRFVRYVLGHEGQAMWGVREERRPSHRYAPTLYHYPIQPRMYEQRAADLALHENPLEQKLGQHVDPQSARLQGAAISALTRAACRDDNHVLLQLAWEAVVKAGLPRMALEELTAPPLDSEQAYELGQQFTQAHPTAAAELTEKWAKAFRAKYERVMNLLGAVGARSAPGGRAGKS